jgi:hypothetical protein
VIGFILYSVLPLWYLHHIITDANADRTFRIFREQLGKCSIRFYTLMCTCIMTISDAHVIYFLLFVQSPPSWTSTCT